MKIFIPLIILFSLNAQATETHESIMKSCQQKRRSLGIDTKLFGPMAPNALDFEASEVQYLSSPKDQARRQVERIETIVSNPNFYNFRGHVQLANWHRDSKAYWDATDGQACLKGLQRLNIEAQPTKSCSPIPTPVKVKNGFILEGVTFKKGNLDTLTFSCEFLLRLPVLARVLKDNGVKLAQVMSHHRPGTLPFDPEGKGCGPKTTESFHHTGLAMDISGLEMSNGEVLDLHKDFYQGLDEAQELKKETCSGELPKAPKARVLRKIACEIFEKRVFATILTPNYNCGHKDHYHFDLRPRDNRVFLR